MSERRAVARTPIAGLASVSRSFHEPKWVADNRVVVDSTGEQLKILILPPPSESRTLLSGIWQETLALSELARRLFPSTYSFTLLAHSFLRRLFIGLPPLHFAKKAFALQLLFQHPKGLFNIVFPNENFQRCLLFRVSVCAYFLPRCRLVGREIVINASALSAAS